MKELEGRVAVVTGAASGIGRATAGRFAAAGMRVVLADVEEKALAATAAELAGQGAAVLAVPTDVSDPGAVDGLARRTLDRFGAVHVLFNNAGVVVGGPVAELTLEDWRWVLGVNLFGVIHGLHAFLPIMLAQDADGHIVNTASVAGLVSLPFNAPYNVAKFGVVTLSESLYHELAMTGARVKVSVLCPGFVRTRLLEADRNRPPSLPPSARPPTPGEDAFMEMARAAIAGGMDAEAVADRVVDAIRTERFYVLTHPETLPFIRARMEAILEEQPPSLPGPV